MASVMKYHQKNRAKDLPYIFNEETTGMELFIRNIIQEKLNAGISKEDIINNLKIIEPNKDNAIKYENVVKELLDIDIKFNERDYYDLDLDSWKSKSTDVGNFDEFFN